MCLFVAGLLSRTLMTTPQFNFTVKLDDLAFILPQIKIAEAGTPPVTGAVEGLAALNPGLVVDSDSTLGFLPNPALNPLLPITGGPSRQCRAGSLVHDARA